MSFATLLTVAVLASGLAPLCDCRYTPDWASLDSRPLPGWYDQSKVGIFIHWGVFSVPSYRSEWFWWDWQGSSPQPDVVNFMKLNYPPGFTYADFAPKFRATFFNPDQWAELFDSSGAKYIVFTSKHHEGFCNWDTAYSFNWNSKQVGPNRDLIADLAAAIRKRPNLRFGLYHSLYEWFNPLYQNDQRAQFKTRDFAQSKTMPELYELVQRFRPDVVWSDGDWDAPAEYWNSTGFLAWLYNDSPVKDTVVTNDRWGQGVMCKHGGYYTCQDRYNPGTLQPHKWENCMTLDKQSWGYRRNARLADYLTPEELLGTLATTISCGGNLLVNVGPTADGTIDPVMEERLRQLGGWLGVNGEAVYNSTPWSRQNDTATSGVWYTQRAGFVYAFLLNWPAGNRLLLGSLAMATNVTLLGHPTAPTFAATPQGLSVILPALDGTGLRWAWVLRLAGVKTSATPTHSSSSSSSSNGADFVRQRFVENPAAADPDVL